jgi:hypothetical protein
MSGPRTTVLRVRTEAHALVHARAEHLGAPPTDVATVLLQLGAGASDEDVAAALEALPAMDRNRGPDGVFRKSPPDP